MERFGSEVFVRIAELESGVVVQAVVVDSENVVCSMTLLLVEVSVVGSGFWVSVNVPVVQELDILLSEVWSVSSWELKPVVVMGSSI